MVQRLGDSPIWGAASILGGADWPWLGHLSTSIPGSKTQLPISQVYLWFCWLSVKSTLERKVGYNCCVLPSHTSRGGKFVALASVVAPTSSRQTVEDVTLLISVAVIRCDKNLFLSDQIWSDTLEAAFRDATQDSDGGGFFGGWVFWSEERTEKIWQRRMASSGGFLLWILPPKFVSHIRTHLVLDLTWADGLPGYMLLNLWIYCSLHLKIISLSSLMIYRRCVHIMCFLHSCPRVEIYHGDVFPSLNLSIWSEFLLSNLSLLSCTCSELISNHISCGLVWDPGWEWLFQTCFCKDLYGHTFNSQHINQI